MTPLRTSLSLLVGIGCSAPPAAPMHPPPPAPPPAPALSAVEIPAEALPPHGTLMLGDMHGTREIPVFVGRLVATVAQREPVVLAWEISQRFAPSLQEYLASDGSPAMRQKVLATEWWQAPYQDGRRSVAAAELLETLRVLRAAGRPIEVVAIDDDTHLDNEGREDAMARNVIAARRAHPDAAMIVYAGNLHTSRREVSFKPGFPWMAMRVAAGGIPLVSLDARFTDGTAWICRGSQVDQCGVGFVGGRGPELGIRLEPVSNGQFDGWFGVGTLTASPPAGKPELAAGIEARIAAAATSPQAVHAKARRAYDARRYDQCAALLATVASPAADVAYDHACCLALAGRKDEAFERLQYAIAAGLADLPQVETDPDLASLHGDPRWPIKK